MISLEIFLLVKGISAEFCVLVSLFFFEFIAHGNQGLRLSNS